jgi:hypothetical protein
MFTDFSKQFDRIVDKVKNTPIATDPWPHLFITDVFDSEFYSSVLKFYDWPEVKIGPYVSDYKGRDEYIFNVNKVSYRNQLANFNDKTNMLFHALSAKFEETRYVDEFVTCTTQLWDDDNRLNINDIHTDQFFDCDFSLSGQFYLPADNTQVDYGTTLYNYLGDDLSKHTYMESGHTYPTSVLEEFEEYFGNAKTLPFIPNSVLFTTNNPGTWHRAPINIRENDKRKSLMLRWKI